MPLCSCTTWLRKIYPALECRLAPYLNVCSTEECASRCKLPDIRRVHVGTAVGLELWPHIYSRGPGHGDDGGVFRTTANCETETRARSRDIYISRDLWRVHVTTKCHRPTQRIHSPSIAIIKTFIVFLGAGAGGVVGGGVVGGGGGGGGCRYPQTLICLGGGEPAGGRLGIALHRKQFSDGSFWFHAIHSELAAHYRPDEVR